MSVLIKNMDMPTERESYTITVKYNGLVFDAETGIQVAEAHEIPPHGRLIDGDVAEVISFTDKVARGGDFADGVMYAVDFISEMPTIIEAEPEVHVCDNCKWFGGLMCDHVDENNKCLGWEAEDGE